MSFDIEVGVSGGDVELNVVREEAEVRNDVVGGIRAGVEVDILGDVHASDVVSVVDGRESAIGLDNGWLESSGEGGKGSRGPDDGSIETASGVRHCCGC